MQGKVRAGRSLSRGKESLRYGVLLGSAEPNRRRLSPIPDGERHHFDELVHFPSGAADYSEQGFMRSTFAQDQGEPDARSM
jgi:hypothetical protein